jgi:hypothetical protein
VIYALIISIQVGSLHETYRWTEHPTLQECVAAGEKERETLADNFESVDYVCRREQRQ